MVEEENNQEIKQATKEDVIELAEFMGIEKGTCSWDTPTNKFVHMLNSMMMHELASNRVNQDCLMILIGQPMNQLEAIKESYKAFTDAIERANNDYKKERKNKEEIRAKLDNASWRNSHIERSNRFARVIAEMALNDSNQLYDAIREAREMFHIFDDE
tara:strand:- start:164 stop:637 length:474 start_codon:yes stop_codon:yes gene_type:complete